VPLYSDIHCPRNGVMLIHKKSVKYLKGKHQSNTNGDLMSFRKQGGSIFYLGNASSGQGHAAFYNAYLAGFIGMYSDRPRNHGWLKDITEVGSAY